MRAISATDADSIGTVRVMNISIMWLPVAIASALLGGVFAFYPWFVTAFAALVILGMAMYARPAFGAYLLMIFVPLRTLYVSFYDPHRGLSEYYPVSLLPVFFVFFVTLASRIASGRPRCAMVGETILAVFAAFALISYLWTYDNYHGAFMGISLIAGLMTLEVFQQNIRTFGELKAALWTFTLLLACWAVTMSISFFYGNFEWKTNIYNGISLDYLIMALGKRAGGFDGPHASSSNVVMVLYMLLALAYLHRPRWRPLLAALAIYFMFNMFFTGNKGAAISLVGSVCFMVAVYAPMRRRALIWLASSGAAILGVYIFVAKVLKADRLTKSSDISTLSFTSRFGYWKKGILSMEPTSWFGWGIGGFERVIAPVPHAHSFYFNILFDLGLIGFALFMFYILRRGLAVTLDIVKCRNWRVKLVMTCLSAALVAQMIFNLVEFSYRYLHIWMYLGLLGAAQAISWKPDDGSGAPTDV